MSLVQMELFLYISRQLVKADIYLEEIAGTYDINFLHTLFLRNFAVRGYTMHSRHIEHLPLV
jgi:hypothetical protein